MTTSDELPSAAHPVVPRRRRRVAFAAKRTIDIVVAALALVLLAPVIAAIAVAIRVKMGSPVFFRQVRPGYLGQPFEIVKFRSMLPEHAADGRPLDLNDRITRLGYLLRRSSLDELPELWNVLRGEMSLVGPRPLIMQYLPRYTPEQARRHGVKPGITGLAQVSGRHSLAWEERFRLDVWYVDHWTLPGDFRICLATIKIALQGSGTIDTAASEFEFLGQERNTPEGTPPASDHGQGQD